MTKLCYFSVVTEPRVQATRNRKSRTKVRKEPHSNKNTVKGNHIHCELALQVRSSNLTNRCLRGTCTSLRISSDTKPTDEGPCDWGTDIPVETRKGRREIKIKRYLMGDEKENLSVCVCVCVCVCVLT